MTAFPLTTTACPIGLISTGQSFGTTCEHERAYAREHRIADSLQRVLLRPHAHEALPSCCVEAFHEAVLDEAAVGGDSCDAFTLDGGRVALVVADASGKGLEAAERAAEIRFALRAFLREHAGPGRALSCLNDFVCDAQRLGRRDDSAFATLTLVVLDGASGEAACLCAGGEPPLLLRAGGAVEAVPICGPALGLLPSQGYAAATVYLGPGDTILLATDGLTEARGLAPDGPAGSRVGGFLDLDGLARLAAATQELARASDAEASLSRIGRSIFESVRTFAGGSFHDDACLLVARRGKEGGR